MDRYWVNQPSTLQRDHALHGKLVLADINDVTTCRNSPDCRTWEQGRFALVYFTDGDKVSGLVEVSALSSGWPTHLQREVKSE